MAADTNGLLPLLTPAAPDLDLHASAVPRIIAVSVVLMVLSTTAVVLRVIARYLSRAGMWWDDWTILAAMFMSWGACICMLVSTNHGFGQHIEALGDFPARIVAAEAWFKAFYIYETIYTVGVALCKYSILLFYSRIFKEKPFVYYLWGTFALVTAWFLAIEITVLVECQPVSSLWDFTIQGTCIDLSKFFVGAGVPNIILNGIILVMPLPMIWTLEIENKHKVALSSVFLLGGFVVVVSIVRAIILSRLEQVDITWEFVDAAIWTSVEPCIGVVSACLPILRSLWIWRRPQNSSAARSRTAKVSVASHRSTMRPTEKDRTSFTSSHPLNELSAEGELSWANQQQQLAPNGKKSSGGSGEVLNHVPETELQVRATDPRHKRASSTSTKTGLPPVAELYG